MDPTGLPRGRGWDDKVNHIQTTYGTKNWSYWSGKSILGLRGKGWGMRGKGKGWGGEGLWVGVSGEGAFYFMWIDNV